MGWAASKPVGPRFRRRALRASLVGSELTGCSIRCVLFADVGAYMLQFEPDGRYCVTAGPEVLAGEVSFFTAQASDRDGALPFQKADHRCHRVLGWNRYAHMDVIRH